MKIKLLLVEDERSIRQMLCMALEEDGFEIDQASTAEQAWRILLECFKENKAPPELILLDWMLPGASGLEFCKKLKKHSDAASIPIIMLTARGEEIDKIKGLDSGADDYVVKPFSPGELKARIKAVLRRQPGHKADELLQVGEIKMDLESHQVNVGAAEITLGPTEFKLLKFFMQNTNKVYTRTQLLDFVWGHQVIIEERTVDVHIRRLRQSLEKTDANNQIKTVRGSGYKLLG